MVTFTQHGQLGPIITDETGELAAPERVVDSCDTCGALVIATRTVAHAATHGETK